MGGIRHSRVVRRSEPFSLRLRERDLWLLEALDKMRFLTTTQIKRLRFGSSRSAANKRLRRLLDAKLIRVWVRDLARDNIYSLAPAGLKLVEYGDEEIFQPVPRGLDGNLGHLLGINDVRITLALTLSETGGELKWWRSDWELRGLSRKGVIPDAMFEVRWGSTTQVFALEFDHRTHSPQGFHRKLLRYAAVRQQARDIGGIGDFLVLVVGTDPRWVERYRLHTGDLVAGLFWFADAAAVMEHGATGRIWQGAEWDGRCSLWELANLPYGKEGCTTGTTINVRT